MSKYIVRYGTMRNLGVMTARSEYQRGMEVVIRSDRGVEVGQVLCESTEDALSHLDHPPIGTIVRAVDHDDAVSIDSIESSRLKEIDVCQRHVETLGLKMKLVEVERLLGGQRMVVYYVSDQRVDFRELVKLLANDFQTRIEMRQVGVRDEAKILADYGDCGKPVCCNNHLVKMPPVSMRMAKLQKASLDPTKISGRCGRLKCCLRYEFDTYEEIQKSLPNVGWQVVTRDGKGRVIAQQILAQQLLIETEDNRRMLIEASEVLSVIKKAAPPRKSLQAKQTVEAKHALEEKTTLPKKRKRPEKKTLPEKETLQEKKTAPAKKTRREKKPLQDKKKPTVASVDAPNSPVNPKTEATPNANRNSKNKPRKKRKPRGRRPDASDPPS